MSKTANRLLITSVLVIIIGVSLLCGVAINESILEDRQHDADVTYINPFENRFKIYRTSNTYDIYVDTETGVCYIGNSDHLIPLLNADGSLHCVDSLE